MKNKNSNDTIFPTLVQKDDGINLPVQSGYANTRKHTPKKDFLYVQGRSQSPAPTKVIEEKEPRRLRSTSPMHRT